MKLRALCRIQGTHRSRQSKSVTLPWQTQTGVGKHISRALGNRPSLPNPSSSPAGNASSLNQTGTSSSVSQMVESALPAPGTAALSSMQRCLPARPCTWVSEGRRTRPWKRLSLHREPVLLPPAEASLRHRKKATTIISCCWLQGPRASVSLSNLAGEGKVYEQSRTWGTTCKGFMERRDEKEHCPKCFPRLTHFVLLKVLLIDVKFCRGLLLLFEAE